MEDDPKLSRFYSGFYLQGTDQPPTRSALLAPVLGLYGAADQGIPVDTIEKMTAARKPAGKTCEIKICPDTPHGFDYRPSYRPEAARDGWAKMLAWFKQNGGRGKARVTGSLVPERAGSPLLGASRS